MLHCCQKSSETSSLGPYFECLKISNKTFLKSLYGIQHSGLQMKIKNIEQLSVSVKLRHKKHFSMSFLSKIPLLLSSGKQKTSIISNTNYFKYIFANINIFSLQNLVLTSIVVELFITMDLMLLDSLSSLVIFLFVPFFFF